MLVTGTTIVLKPQHQMSLVSQLESDSSSAPAANPAPAECQRREFVEQAAVEAVGVLRAAGGRATIVT